MLVVCVYNSIRSKSPDDNPNPSLLHISHESGTLWKTYALMTERSMISTTWFLEIQFCVIFALKDRHFPHKQLLYWWTLENASGGVDNSLHFQEITKINLEKNILENYAYFWRFVESKTMCLMYVSLESWGTYRNFSLIKSTISSLCN